MANLRWPLAAGRWPLAAGPFGRHFISFLILFFAADFSVNPPTTACGLKKQKLPPEWVKWVKSAATVLCRTNGVCSCGGMCGRRRPII